MCSCPEWNLNEENDQIRKVARFKLNFICFIAACSFLSRYIPHKTLNKRGHYLLHTPVKYLLRSYQDRTISVWIQEESDE